METLIVAVALTTMPAQQTPVPNHDTRIAATCFKTGENTSGMNKICFYDCLGSQTAITIGATDLCPLSINR